MTKERRVGPVSRTSAEQYLAKAKEFLDAAEALLSDEHWNASGVMAIHAGISAADAVLAKNAGIRSREVDHAAILSLLDKQAGGCPERTRRQISGLLKMKNSLEYEARLATQVEAVQLKDHAARVVRWAAKTVRGDDPG